MSNRKTIIFDFDGTLTDFRKIDNQIIGDIFKGHAIILLIDRFLWCVNGLGLFGNSMFGLKIRLYLYSLFSFKTTKRYIHVLVKYEEMYIKLSSSLQDSVIKSLRRTKEKYDIIVISNNFFAKKIIIDGIKVEYAYKKRKLFRIKREKNDVAYIVGDNLFDDYRNSKGIPFIYVGNSVIAKLILKLSFSKKVSIVGIENIEDVVF